MLRERLAKILFRFEASASSLETICEDIAEEVANSAKRDEDEYLAWGQYVDSPTNNGQVGIYGTARAIQILALSDRDWKDEILMGQQWLYDQWTGAGTRTKEKCQHAVTYKHAVFLEALDPADEPFLLADGGPDRHINPVQYVHDDFDEFCTDLWEKRIDEDESGEKSGWGEYQYYDSEAEDDDFEVLSTVFALLALLRSENYCEKQRAHVEDIMFSLSDEVEGIISKFNNNETKSKKETVVELGFTLMALARYKKKRDGNVPTKINKQIDNVALTLEDTVYSGDTMSANTYYFNLFTTPKPSFRNRYLHFIPSVVVSLAFIEAGPRYVVRNYPYIKRVLEFFKRKIAGEGKDVYTSPETGYSATVDQFWISTMFREFLARSIDYVRFRDIFRGGYRWVGKEMSLFLLLIGSVIMWFIVFRHLLNPYPDLQNALSVVITLISGGILSQIGIPDTVTERL